MTTWRPSSQSPSEREPRHVSEGLGKVTRRIGAPEPDVVSALFGRWEQLVGADIAAHCRPVSVRDGVLHLVADQPAWASQIRFMAGDILSVVATATASGEVREIRVRVSDEDPGRRRRDDATR
jgi:predicted nucleic acid-binding Zn ribbon protein